SATVPVLRDARHPLFLGWSGFANEFFKGELAEVRIWNTALSARRIASIWNRAVAVPQADLVACYRFAEGAGTIAHDSSRDGNHGPAPGGPERGARGSRRAEECSSRRNRAPRNPLRRPAFRRRSAIHGGH